MAPLGAGAAPVVESEPVSDPQQADKPRPPVETDKSAEPQAVEPESVTAPEPEPARETETAGEREPVTDAKQADKPQPPVEPDKSAEPQAVEPEPVTAPEPEPARETETAGEREPVTDAKQADKPQPPVEPDKSAEPQAVEPEPEPVTAPEPEPAPAGQAAAPAPIELPVAEPPTVTPPVPAAAPAAVQYLFPRALGSTFDRQLLRDLPSEGLWSLFETIESTAILDRIDGAGMYVGEAGLVGIRGSSWTQASWRMGDLDITDPDRTGTPLFFGDPDQIEVVEIAAGLSPADQRGIGPGISLILRRPGDAWRKSLQWSQAPSILQQTRAAGIARLESFGSGAFRIDGPLVEDRLGLVVSASTARGARRERDDPRSLRGRQDSLLAHLVYTPTPSDEVRFVTGLQGVSHPYEGRARFGGGDVSQSDRFFQAQATWQRAGPRPWTVSAGLVRGSFDPDLPGVSTGIIERTEDGPVQLQFRGASSRGRFALSGAFDPLTNAHHALRLGASLSFMHSTTRPAGARGFLTAETVAGLPARVWDYGWAGPVSRWRGSEVALYATDQVHYGRLSVDAGLRFESARGSAQRSPSRIRWSDLSSCFMARLRPFGGAGLSLLGGYATYHGRLPLSLLAYGDPAGLQGRVYRWRDDNGDGLYEAEEKGELIARMGPGGDRASIDPRLQAPRSRDVFVGLESLAGRWRFRFLAYHRRERDLVRSLNVGAPASAYDLHFITDPANDIALPDDDYLLPVYNRRLETFGEDRYLLTNDPEKGHGKGLELLVEGSIGRRLRLIVGGTASKALAPAAYRGFRATENDQGLVGERAELPNASTLSKGRLFFERGYNLKVAGIYEAPHDVRLGVVARYQDGQHFARFVIATDLNQGPEPIRGITNGESRFTFVLTIDARVEKGFALGPRRLAGVFEAFNLAGSSIEVEEHVIWGPVYRASSAVQPPRTVRLGLRLDF